MLSDGNGSSAVDADDDDWSWMADPRKVSAALLANHGKTVGRLHALQAAIMWFPQSVPCLLFPTTLLHRGLVPQSVPCLFYPENLLHRGLGNLTSYEECARHRHLALLQLCHKTLPMDAEMQCEVMTIAARRNALDIVQWCIRSFVYTGDQIQKMFESAVDACAVDTADYLWYIAMSLLGAIVPPLHVVHTVDMAHRFLPTTTALDLDMLLVENLWRGFSANNVIELCRKGARYPLSTRVKSEWAETELIRSTLQLWSTEHSLCKLNTSMMNAIAQQLLQNNFAKTKTNNNNKSIRSFPAFIAELLRGRLMQRRELDEIPNTIVTTASGWCIHWSLRVHFPMGVTWEIAEFFLTWDWLESQDGASTSDETWYEPSAL